MLAITLSLCPGLAVAAVDAAGGDGSLSAWALEDPTMELIEFSEADRAAALAAGPLDW